MFSNTPHDELFKNILYLPAFLLGLSLRSFTILGVFMVIDVITGIMRAYVVHGGHSIKSYRLGAGVLSKGCIIMVPVLLAWGGEGAGFDLTAVASGRLSVLILAELYSILGNIQSIRLGKDIMEFDAINFIILKLRDYLEGLLKKDHEQK